MRFKGRTVLAFVMLSIVASVAVTLVVTDKLDPSPVATTSSIVSAAKDTDNQLTENELNRINSVIDIVESKYVSQVERNELIDGAITGILNALDDPYSVYMEKEIANQFSQSIEGSFTGIGAEVTVENGQIVVVSPIKGSPAEKGGLLSKDIIVSVNGDSLSGLSLQEAVKKIRGEKGSKAKLEVIRSGNSEPLNIVVTRDDIDIETVYASIDDQGIGLIEITQFSMHTAERFAQELATLEQKGMKGLVIDVRNNPGGVLQGVVEIAQLMMKEGSIVVQVEDRNGKKEKTYATGGEKKEYPIVVLTNGGSASASEILAGALQEGAGATVLGQQTYGKGTVQVSFNEKSEEGGLIKLTIAKWLTPNGNWINTTGVIPDIVVEPAVVYSVARLNLTEDLKYDAWSEQVRSLQVMLQALGYEIDRTDGYFNKATESAVLSFQKEHKLKQTGIVNSDIASKLEEEVISYIRDANHDVQLQKAFQEAGRK